MLCRAMWLFGVFFQNGRQPPSWMAKVTPMAKVAPVYGSAFRSAIPDPDNSTLQTLSGSDVSLHSYFHLKFSKSARSVGRWLVVDRQHSHFLSLFHTIIEQ